MRTATKIHLQSLVKLMTLLAFAFVSGCEYEEEEEATSSHSSSSSGQTHTYYRYVVTFYAHNHTRKDATVRIRGPGGSYTATVKAGGKYTFWARNISRGTTVYLETWNPRFTRWMEQTSETVYDSDVSGSVSITMHTYGGL
jgi:hypothetical protein